MGKYKLSPSSSERFLNCTASLPLNTKAFSENKFSLIGTLQHEVSQLRIEEMLDGKDNGDKVSKLMTEPFLSSDKTFDVSWNKDCESNVDQYVSYIRSLIKEYKPKIWFVEYRVKFKFFGNEINGIIDFVMITPDNDVFIVDLKTGRGYVETKGNSQMLMYATGIAQDLNKKGIRVNSVIISIFQPIINNVKAVKYSLNQMVKWYKKQELPMHEINTDQLVFRPTKMGCKYCEYNKNCNERIKAGVF